MEEFLSVSREMPVQRIVDDLFGWWSDYGGEQPTDDDATMVLIRFLGPTDGDVDSPEEKG